MRKREALYTGALSARAMHTLQGVRNAVVYYGHLHLYMKRKLVHDTAFEPAQEIDTRLGQFIDLQWPKRDASGRRFCSM
jgi:hypothetical protein